MMRNFALLVLGFLLIASSAMATSMKRDIAVWVGPRGSDREKQEQCEGYCSQLVLSAKASGDFDQYSESYCEVREELGSASSATTTSCVLVGMKKIGARD